MHKFCQHVSGYVHNLIVEIIIIEVKFEDISYKQMTFILNGLHDWALRNLA